MSASPAAYQQRRDWFMKVNIRCRLRDEIIAQARCTVRHLRHLPGTHFDVVLKMPRDANGNTITAWRAILIRYKNDNDSGFWRFVTGSVNHASQEEALNYTLKQLQRGGLRGTVVEGSQEDEEFVHEEEPEEEFVGREEQEEQR